MSIERTESNGIVTLRLAHGKASAMDVELLEALDRELVAAEQARAIILTGSGSIFSAGVDLFRVLDGGADYVRRFFPLLRDVIRRLFAMRQPVIAAANGHAIAGGAILVFSCDIRLMAPGGRIGVPELLVGVPFPAVPLEIVRFAVRNDRLQQLVLTGRTLPAEEALALGMIDEVLDGAALLERANAVAAQLAAVPPDAFRLTKEQLRAPALENMTRLGDVNDAQALAAWCDPATHARIRDYLDRTLKK